MTEKNTNISIDKTKLTTADTKPSIANLTTDTYFCQVKGALISIFWKNKHFKRQ